MTHLNEKALYELVNRLSVQHFNKVFKHEVRFNHRLRTTGGRYIPGKKVIELNPKYVAELGENEFIGIIKHELCHYHLHIEGRGFSHGDADFKKLLRETGSPRYCTPLPSRQKDYKYRYACRKCNHEYKRMRRVNVDKYRCGKCRGRLILKTQSK